MMSARKDEGAILRFLRWWGAGLAACLPEPLRRGLGLERELAVIALEADGATISRLRGEAREEVGRIGEVERVRPDLANRFVLVRLPAGEGLAKTVSLPLAAEENLREVLEFEMERQTPFSADQVYFDWRLIERRPLEKELRLRLLVAPRDKVDGAARRLAGWGVRADALDIDIDPPSATGLNLLPPDLRPVRRAPAGTAVLAAAACGLALLALFSPFLQAWYRELRADAELDRIKPSVDRVLAQRVELDRLSGGLARVAQEKKQLPPATLVLEELSRIFPDTAWIGDLALGKGTLEISGASASAARLVSVIESSRLFEKVDFRTTVTRDPVSGQERFQFEVDLARGGWQ